MKDEVRDISGVARDWDDIDKVDGRLRLNNHFLLSGVKVEDNQFVPVIALERK